MKSIPNSERNPWPEFFEKNAERYDQSGVPFFTTFARRLVELLAPQPGERALDIGSGRGAVAFRLADAVGTDGRVDALDIAPSMVRLLSEEATARGLTQVQGEVGDASDPRPPAPPYDVLASSLVLHFLPEPLAALIRWIPLVRPAGRVGISSFLPFAGRFDDLNQLVVEYAGPAPTARGGTPFDTDEGVETLFEQAGFVDVRTVTEQHPIPFADAAQWRAWSMGTVLRRLWADSDPERHDEILDRVMSVLDGNRDAQGRLSLDVGIRYTLARRLGAA